MGVFGSGMGFGLSVFVKMSNPPTPEAYKSAGKVDWRCSSQEQVCCCLILRMRAKWSTVLFPAFLLRLGKFGK